MTLPEMIRQGLFVRLVKMYEIFARDKGIRCHIFPLSKYVLLMMNERKGGNDKNEKGCTPLGYSAVQQYFFERVFSDGPNCRPEAGI
jgi:hypothetical protein